MGILDIFKKKRFLSWEEFGDHIDGKVDTRFDRPRRLKTYNRKFKVF